MESNIQQANKYRAIAEAIDALETELIIKSGLINMGNSQDRVIIKSIETLKDAVIDISIAFEDKITENC